MPKQVLTNARLWIGAHNFSGDANALVLDYLAELKDDTALLDVARSRLPGLRACALQAEGYINSGVGEIDAPLFDSIGLSDVPVTVCPIAGAAEGDRAFTMLAAGADYQQQAPVGELYRFSAGAQCRGVPLIRGQLLHNNTRTASGNGTGQQLGALAAGQKLFASLHVLTVSGGSPSLTVAVQSATSQGGSYTSRITFGAKTAPGYEWGSVTGAISGDPAWWRANWTISGSTPSFVFVVAAGLAT